MLYVTKIKFSLDNLQWFGILEYVVAKEIYQCRQCVSKRTLADEKEVNTFIEDDTWENGIFGAAQMRGGQDLFSRIQIGGPILFFKSEKWGLGLFLRLKKWGPGLFLRFKKWGQELFWTGEIGGLVAFFDREIPQNPAWVPGKFWTVP